jgi:hypothetical protein
MTITVTQSFFHDAFRNMGRADEFTYEGRAALFDYLEELYDSTGETYELDVIALCCDFSEHDSAEDAAHEYGWSEENGDATSWLLERTAVIEVGKTGRVIIQGF